MFRNLYQNAQTFVPMDDMSNLNTCLSITQLGFSMNCCRVNLVSLYLKADCSERYFKTIMHLQFKLFMTSFNAFEKIIHQVPSDRLRIILRDYGSCGIADVLGHDANGANYHRRGKTVFILDFFLK